MVDMKVSDKGLLELMEHEAIVPMPYLDSVGVLTFGIGHTASAGDPDPADLPQGVEQDISYVISTFKRDIEKFSDRVNRAITAPTQQYQFDALVSFDYNTGGIFEARLTDFHNAGDYDAAADAFMGWLKPPEIVGRRKKEQALYRDGKYTSDGRIPVYHTKPGSYNIDWSNGKLVDVTEFISPTEPPIEPPVELPITLPTGMTAKLRGTLKLVDIEWEIDDNTDDTL